MNLAFGTIALGLAVFLGRRRLARWKAESHRSFDRAYDEGGLAWFYGAMGALLVAFGLVFLGIAVRDLP